MGRRKRFALTQVCVCGVLALAASSSTAAITLGPNPLPQRTSVISSGGARIFTNAVVPGAVLASPIDGIVTRWRARRGSGPGVMVADTIALRILRPTGITNEFTAEGTSQGESVPGGSNDPIDVYEFRTQLPIKAGDRIGLGVNAGEFPARAEPGSSYLTRINPLADGETATFSNGAFAPDEVLINADVEPDANCDGLGDETQEAVVSGGCLPAKPASLSVKKAKAKKRQVALGISCAVAGGNCTDNQIALTAKSAVAARKLTLGSASFSLAAGQSQVVAVTLTKKGAKLLKRVRKLTATATISAGSTSTTGKIKLRR